MSTSGRVLLFALTVAVALATSGLGVWQLSRLTDRRARNESALAGRALPPVDLNRSVLPRGATYRRVVAEGTYDFDREIVLRNRLLLGTPGVQVLTPLRLPGRDTAVLVNRGFVPSPDAGPPPPGVRYAEPAAAAVEGVALPMPDEGDGKPITTAGGTSWQRLELSAIRSRLPYPVAWYYVVAQADSTRTTDHTARGTVLPVRVDPPSLDEGPHLSYAIQWFMIAAAALGFGLIVILRVGSARSVNAP